MDCSVSYATPTHNTLRSEVGRTSFSRHYKINQTPSVVSSLSQTNVITASRELEIVYIQSFETEGLLELVPCVFFGINLSKYLPCLISFELSRVSPNWLQYFQPVLLAGHSSRNPIRLYKSNYRTLLQEMWSKHFKKVFPINVLLQVCIVCGWLHRTALINPAETSSRGWWRVGTKLSFLYSSQI